ncbi:MAG: DnaD domain protein [Verrucomicrobiales bacterium]|nr:DnaD domain protein [Verrucomicrobiales bacterium]
MPPFQGFPTSKTRLTAIPGAFFSDLLPEIDDLAELKVALYALWRLEQMEGNFRALRAADFAGDKTFMAGLGEKPEVMLEEGLKKNAARGTLLKAEVEFGGKTETFYVLNDARGQAAVKAIRQGKWNPTSDPQFPIELALEKPNIFRLYEEHIGPLTPMLAEGLQEAEDTYPPEWIEEAMRAAVENNVRKWSYVEAILKRWQSEGRDDGTHQRDAKKARKRYFEGEYSDRTEH